MKRTNSYASGISEKPLLGYTIGEMLDIIAGLYPDNEALVVRHQNLRYTYRKLKEKVDECARALMVHGIEKGDRVGIWSPNNAEWAITQFATARIGAILVNINPAYRLHEVEYALKQSGCSMLITADRFKSSDYTGMLNQVIPSLSTADKADIRSSYLPDLRQIIRIDPNPVPGMYTWNELLSVSSRINKEQLEERAASLSFEDPINIQYTSGTTGYPKAATLSHHNILNNGYFVADLMRLSENDRLVIPVPLYHCFGMVLGNIGCMSHGATMIYPGEAFEAQKVLETIQLEKATALFGVPTMFIAELEDSEFSNYDLRSLRTGVMAGAPCPIEVMKKVMIQMHMQEVEIAYGMTETSPVSTQTRWDESLENRVATVGSVHPHVEIKVIDPETGRTQPVGVAGELCTRGYSVMLGYWNDEERTKEAIDPKGWMHSGDLATMDENGYLKIVGRIKDMIIRGGENIYPREIEEFLYSHPKISEVQVIGVPDERFGEEIVAWIQLHEGETATGEEIKAFCKGRIAHFKVPRYIRFSDSFPMTVTGKIRKVEMREISIKELELENAAAVQTA
jgi:fatty-acyl-CoA synthase